MQVAFFEIEDWEKEFILSKLPQNTQAEFFREKLSVETAAKAQNCQVISVFIDSQVTPAIVSALPNVKMIATRSTGFDHISATACKEKGITICNVPSYGENTVAEHTFALILALSRKLYDSIDAVKKEGFSIHGMRGFDLKGKTLGIVGLGHIGQHVARIAQGFEMKVVVSDVNHDKKLAKKLGFQYAALEDLLKNADMVTLHLPYNEKTHHIINAGNITLLKKGAYIINTARGGLVETEALIKSLDSGLLAGAALDVLEEECFIKEEGQLLSADFYKKCDLKTMLQNHMLMERKNVIITPHNAFNSQEALERILQTTVENIIAFGKGRQINTVG